LQNFKFFDMVWREAVEPNGMQMDDSQNQQSAPPNHPVEDWYRQPLLKFLIITLVILMILLLLASTKPVWGPIVEFVSILATPIIISFLFYYLLRPIVHSLERLKIPRPLAICLIYILIAIGLTFFFIYAGPIIADQMTALANTSWQRLERVEARSQSFLSRFFHFNVDVEIKQRLFYIAQQVTSLLSTNLISILSFATRIATVLAIIPFIVFYLLKDDEEFATNFLHHVPKEFTHEVHKILRDMDETLSSYIHGLLLVSSSVGGLLFIGYLMIGLNNALILSLIAFMVTTIPFLGPFLAIAPALFVGVSHGLWMVIKIVIVFIIVQQLESNVISPQIIGQRLNIHPLTLILLLLAAGSLYGVIGLLLATPLYALLKVLIENLYKIHRLRHPFRSSSSDR
jgi:predicted PurR-regulated permease PerM